MKNNLLLAILIVFGNVLYAQDVVLETINETQFGAKNGQVTVKVQNVGPGAGQNAQGKRIKTATAVEYK